MELSGPIALAVLATCLGVGGCFAADSTGRRIFEWVGKPTASLAFFLLGLYTARQEQVAAAPAFVAALGLSVIGDLALMGRSNASFLVGLGAFLLGHLAFVVAFALRGLSLTWILGGIMLVAVPGFGVALWLLPHVTGRMRPPVIAYMGVISAMVICACGTHGYATAPELLLAAIMFFVSDLAVAREKFVANDGWNRIWGLPLYFGAQLLFAANLLH